MAVSPLPAQASAAARRAVAGLDPRARIVTGVAMGLAAWKAGPLGLAVLALALAPLNAALSRRGGPARGTLWPALAFALGWGGLKLGLDLLGGSSLPQAAAAAGMLASRLLVLVLVGLTLSAAASPRELGLAVSWLLRPLLRGRAWQAALALALMLHFLPLALSSAREISATMARRCPDLPLRSRVPLLATALLRRMGTRTWQQAMAIAARGLDEPDAWSGMPFPGPRDFALTAALLGMIGALGTLG